MAQLGSPNFFTPAFLYELDNLLSFRFKFLRSRSKKLTGRQGLYKSLFDAFMEAGEIGSSNLPEPDQWMEYSLDAETEAVA